MEKKKVNLSTRFGENIYHESGDSPPIVERHGNPLTKKIRRNDMKKGDIVSLYKSGGQVKGEIWDNSRGPTRMMKVEVLGQPGSYDYGDTYVHEIDYVMKHLGEEGYWEIEYTDKEQKEVDKLKREGW